MIRHLLICLLITGSAITSAQIKVSPALKQRIDGIDKLDEVMLQVDRFYKSKPASDKQSFREWKHWKRWEWEMSRYVNSDGKLVNTKEVYYNALLQRQQEQRLTELNESTGQWAFIGPANFSHRNGSGRGLGRINRIAFDPSNSTHMYLGTPNGGLWRSTNSATSFSPVSTYGPNLGISGIVVSHADPNDIYVLTGDGDGGGFITAFGYRSYSVGIMKSTNGGSTWVLQSNGLPSNQLAGFSLVQSNTNPLVLLAATNYGLYRTGDGGNNWTRVINGYCTDVKFKPGSGLTCYAAGNAAVSGWFKYSNDGGITWTEASYNTNMTWANRIQIGVSPANSNYVYLLSGPASNGSFNGVWASTNSGQFFTLRTIVPNILGAETDGSGDSDQSGYDLALAVSSTDINTIFTGGLCVWKSITGGFTFSYSTTYYEGANLAKYIHPDVHDLQVNPFTGHLWAATDGGLYRSIDNGTNWTDESAGISTAQIYNLAGSDAYPDLLYYGCQDNGVKNRSTNTQIWRHIYGADGFDVLQDYNNPYRAWWTANQSVRRTIDEGYNAICINVNNCCSGDDCGYEWFGNLAQHVTNPSTIFVGYSDIFISTNAGDTYTQRSDPSGILDIQTCPSNSNRVYSAGSDSYATAGSIYRSDDAGNSWDYLNHPGNGHRITSIGVNPSNSNRVWVTYGGTTDSVKVFYSGDAGNIWTNINSLGLPNMPVNCIAVTPGNDVYIGTEIGVYYRSSGGNWTPYYNGLPPSPVTDLVINELAGKIRASTFGRGVWESPLYANCMANLNFTGTQTGINYYEAATQVTSTALITGGPGTKIFYKGGNNVTLTPGFEANTGSEFKAYINGCGLGGIPDANGRLTSGIDYNSHRLPLGDSTKFPYGTVELNPAGNKVTYRIYKSGGYSLQITDDKGYIIQTLSEKQLSAGMHTFAFTKPSDGDMHYLQLWYNKELVHYQEIH